MRAAAWAFAMMAMFASFGCGTEPPRSEDGGTRSTSAAIVNGVEAPKQLLNVGTLAVKIDGTWRWGGCTGTLIAPGVFLTAAHCVADWETWGLGITGWGVTFAPSIDLSANPWQVWKVQLPESAAVIPGTAVVHPAFNWNWGNYRTAIIADYAVIQLDRRVRNLPPAALPPVGLLSWSEGVLSHVLFGIAGYGTTSFEPFIDGSNPDWGVRRYSTTRLAEIYPGSFELSETPGQVCYFDSGGPAFPTMARVGGRIPPPRFVPVVLGLVRDMVDPESPSYDPNDPCKGGTILTRLDLQIAHDFLDPLVARDRD